VNLYFISTSPKEEYERDLFVWAETAVQAKELRLKHYDMDCVDVEPEKEEPQVFVVPIKPPTQAQAQALGWHLDVRSTDQ